MRSIAPYHDGNVIGLGGIRTRDLFVANETRYCCATSPCSNNLAGKGFKPSDLPKSDNNQAFLAISPITGIEVIVPLKAWYPTYSP